MEIVRKEYSFKSATGLCDIYARSWAPADKESVKAIFQITHGMAEHGERYARFAKKLCEHGYAVFAQDHIGHGKSVASDDDLGYFGEKDGWRDFVIDCRSLTDIAREEYPGKPVVFFGHSMGSFIARNYTAKYNDVQAAIFCGTSGKNPAAPIAIKLASFVARAAAAAIRVSLSTTSLSATTTRSSIMSRPSLIGSPKTRTRFRSISTINTAASSSARQAIKTCSLSSIPSPARIGMSSSLPISRFSSSPVQWIPSAIIQRA